MTTNDNQLFSAEDALLRLGQNKEQGCLLVSKGPEMVTIYVKNGFVLSAVSSRATGKDAVAHALHLTESSYQWIRGVQPPTEAGDLNLGLHEFVLTNGRGVKDKTTATGKIHLKPEDPAAEPKYNYFLVPINQPTTRLNLTKTATVLGRDRTSDLVIDDKNVSSRHCLLDIRSRGVFILDLDSTNGTYVNGVFVKDGYVDLGDVIELGDHRLTLNRELRK